MAIQSDRFPNARMLAERCEVSRRTIYRDLETLAAAGIPVHYRPERQGYQLARGYSLPLPSLDEKEALALLTMARQWKGGAGFDLLRHARDGAVKLIQALPADVRSRVLTQAEPIPDDTSRCSLAPRSKARLRRDPRRLGGRLQLRIWYRDDTAAITANEQAEPLSARPRARDLVRGRPLDVPPPGLHLPDSLDRSGHTDERSATRFPPVSIWTASWDGLGHGAGQGPPRGLAPFQCPGGPRDS